MHASTACRPSSPPVILMHIPWPPILDPKDMTPGSLWFEEKDQTSKGSLLLRHPAPNASGEEYSWVYQQFLWALEDKVAGGPSRSGFYPAHPRSGQVIAAGFSQAECDALISKPPAADPRLFEVLAHLKDHFGLLLPVVREPPRPQLVLEVSEISLLDLMTHPELPGGFKSKREAKQRIEGGIIQVDGKPTYNVFHVISGDSALVQIGMRVPVQVVLNSGT